MPAFGIDKIGKARSNRQGPRFDHRARAHRGPHVEPERQCRQRDVAHRHGPHRQHQQALGPTEMAVRIHRLGKPPDQQRHRTRQHGRYQQGVGHGMRGRIGIINLALALAAIGPAGFIQTLRQAPRLPQRGQQAGEFDHHQRRGQPSHRAGTIQPAGNEQKRHAGDQTDQKTQDIGTSAFGQRGNIAVIARHKRGLPCRYRHVCILRAGYCLGQAFNPPTSLRPVRTAAAAPAGHRPLPAPESGPIPMPQRHRQSASQCPACAPVPTPPAR